MSRFKVVVTDYIYPSLDTEREVLAAIDAELVPCQCKTLDDARRAVAGADGVLNTYFRPLDGQVMDAMPNCRIIVRYGIGVDTINIPDATARGIMVANVPDYGIAEVSDQALAFTLALVRKLPQADRRVHRGEWDPTALKPIRRLSALTVGIIGLGRIGRVIARKLVAFGPTLVFHDPYLTADTVEGARRVDLPELFRIADVVIVQAPATKETRHLLDRQAFAAMQRRPIVVNCARGDLIDTAALIEALQTGQVSGAGLDVVEPEPLPADSPLRTFENVMITPHAAWYSVEALAALQRLAAEEVARALLGERPKSLLNPEVWERRKPQGR